jgi:hypothetical protein
MVDVAQLSDEELMKLAGGSQGQVDVSQMSDDQLMQIIGEKDPLNIENFLKSLVAAGEVGVSGVTGAFSGLAAYPYGAYVTATEGEEAGEAARAGLREEYTYQPKTEYGQRLTQRIGEFMEPAVSYATEKTQQLGEYTTEQTGSETAGYLAEHLPMFLVDALGSYGITSALKRGTTKQVPLKNTDGTPTAVLVKALDKKGISYDNLPPAQQAAIPAVVTQNMVTRRGGAPAAAQQALEQEVVSGSTQAGAAPFRATERGKIEKDPFAQEAIKQNWDEGFVSLIKQADDATKAKMLEMVNLRRNIMTDRGVLKPKIDPETGVRSTKPTRPSDIPGDELLKKAKFVEEKAIEAATRLNEIARTRLAGKNIDAKPLENQIYAGLDNMDIKVVGQKPSGRPILDFRGSAISKNTAAKNAINDVLDLMEEMGTGQVNALKFHKMKRMLDELIDYRKSGTNEGALTKQAKNFIKDIRKTLNNEVRRVDSEYAKINDQLTQTFDAFDTLREGVGKSLDLSGPAVGQQLRRLFSNTQARTKVENGIIDIDMLSKELGGNFPVDIWDLAQVAAEMDSVLKPVAQTSFAGEIGSQVAQQIAGQSSLQTAISLGKKGVERARGVNPQAQLRALEELLRQRSQSTSAGKRLTPYIDENTDLMP